MDGQHIQQRSKWPPKTVVDPITIFHVTCPRASPDESNSWLASAGRGPFYRRRSQEAAAIDPKTVSHQASGSIAGLQLQSNCPKARIEAADFRSRGRLAWKCHPRTKRATAGSRHWGHPGAGVQTYRARCRCPEETYQSSLSTSPGLAYMAAARSPVKVSAVG
ncbi:uncharacterized protein B0I36DRAFT_154121 [Microdochium trichocladiopsis]|uniref:Uncharacterized protein n=1 Tax=Microdochium trichocladiopsis TaxID=1682393 RepID=A0A9P8Y088_9PEZI|nr:uncharacterized protein B0I36DRAFT_154121 [Microdochium trichocladiopsis]KAH7026135.1 hypothetical protein B0I36DRAFT_154121 [Microdochium trichocladiopsis]